MTFLEEFEQNNITMTSSITGRRTLQLGGR